MSSPAQTQFQGEPYQGSPPPSEVAARAYEIYLNRGRQPGHEVDDWLQAEYELMQLPIRKLAEMKPPKKRKNPRRKSLVELIHMAL